ncbi:MAG: hypothetical protein L6Q29_01015 [Candidatus Pacebacteria bacterium]|nr:hypothetical protein [Candidatus Paceibacterota bacterium]NUQ57136.1 hypothetical protein [Candidatus Paceibacter sp.]
MEKIRIINNGFSTGFWFAAWLFTIGYLNLSFPKLIYAIILWPYYLGLHFSQFFKN